MKPVSEKDRGVLPYGRQSIDDEDIKAVIEVLKSDYVTTGPKIAEFEERLAERTGARYAVVLSSGTAALHAACFAAGIGRGHEVITSPITFAASANCVRFMDARPVFADIDPKTYNIDPDSIRKNITGKTKAVIPVHFTGQPCDMDEIMKIAEQYGLTVIEDGAHALGAEYRGRKVGSIGHMTVFSFHPVKHITTGEGGAVLTDCKDLCERLRMFRSHGITRDHGMLDVNEGPWYYEQQFLGYNYRMTDIQAALGISQLSKLDRFLQKRREYAGMYHESFAGMEEIIIPYQMPGTRSAWHLYVLQLRLEQLRVGRKEIFHALTQRKIGVNVHYIPVYFHPYYRKLGYKAGICPHAESFYERAITLPLFPGMTKEDVFYVVENLKEVLRMYER